MQNVLRESEREEEFEDTKGKKNRQHNGQKKKNRGERGIQSFIHSFIQIVKGEYKT